MSNGTRIVIWHDKHGDHYYDASTNEALAAASLDILSDWLEYGYIYTPEDPLDPERLKQSWASVKQEDVDWAAKPLAEPEDETNALYNDKVRKAKQKVNTAVARYQDDLKSIGRVQKAVDEHDLRVIPAKTWTDSRGRERQQREQVYAWVLLQEYSGGEYQEVEDEYLTDAQADWEAAQAKKEETVDA